MTSPPTATPSAPPLLHSPPQMPLLPHTCRPLLQCLPLLCLTPTHPSRHSAKATSSGKLQACPQQMSFPPQSVQEPQTMLA